MDNLLILERLDRIERFFDKTTAWLIGRQGKMDLPLHTFESFPYRLSLGMFIRCIDYTTYCATFNYIYLTTFFTGN